MLLDISPALRTPGEEFSFTHREEIPPQDIFSETVGFDPVVFNGVFSMAGNSLHIRGQISTTAHTTCARCLAPLPYPVTAPFDEIFVRTERIVREQDDFLEQDEDRLVFEGSKVDLSHLALTLVLLELPLRFVCAAPCEGPVASTLEAHQKTHACQKDTPDQHPFSALQQLLTKDQEV